MADELTIDSIEACDRALARLLTETLRMEKFTAERDLEIARIQHQYQPKMLKSAAVIMALEGDIEMFYDAHRQELEQDGKKSLQLPHGLLGMRAPSHPALVPLNAKWTWEKITDKVRELWGKKFFHAPKEPGLDLVKLKKERTPEQLRECGVQLDTEPRFYYVLNRLASADTTAVA